MHVLKWESIEITMRQRHLISAGLMHRFLHSVTRWKSSDMVKSSRSGTIVLDINPMSTTASGPASKALQVYFSSMQLEEHTLSILKSGNLVIFT